MLANSDPSYALASLRPRFDPEEHEEYVRYLLAAVSGTAPNAPLNIAVTGPYGAGKSSVLLGLIERLGPDLVVPVSIPTISPPSPDATAATVRLESNEIEKEIVKQLLYRERATRLGASRYRRIENVSRRRALTIAAACSFVVLVTTFLSGFSRRFEAWADGNAFLLGLAWILAFAGVAGIAYGAQVYLNWRFTGLRAGPAMITTGGEKETTFDKYLDEIVYFFSATSYSIVFFEDLDRFDRIEIFEELRELNVLLNASKQVGRPIRFVYALRDSVFELLPQSEADAPWTPDGLGSSSARAKFFDLVIPMVPFSTGRTSVDLWTRVMASARAELPPAVLRIASRHVQDMRVIRSVRNEFDVFRRQLARNRFEDLRDASLFALALYKATHLRDFERIQYGRSALDAVESLRRLTISKTLASIERELADLRHPRTSGVLEARALEMEELLVEEVERLLRVSGRPGADFSVRLGDTTYARDELSSAEFWRGLAGSATGIDVISSGVVLSILRADLEHYVGKLALGEWSADDRAADQSRVDELQRLRAELPRYDMATLLDSAEIVAPEPRSLAESARAAAGSEIAFELIDGGFIDENFSLYVSRFYGGVVSVPAMNYVMHVVQPGATDLNAPLPSREDVEGVIHEIGVEVLGTHSALNIDLVDHLASDTRLSRTMRVMADGSSRSLEFLIAYANRGAKREQVFARLARGWAGSLNFAAGFAETDRDLALLLFDLSLRNMSSRIPYRLNAAAATLIRMGADKLSALTDEADTTDPRLIAELLVRSEVSLRNLPARSAFREEVVRLGLFDVNEETLYDAMGSEDRLSLDAISASGPALLLKVLAILPDYLRWLPRSTPTVRNPERLSELLKVAAKAVDDDGIREIVRRATPIPKLRSLEGMPVNAWRALLEDGRVDTTAKVWSQYSSQIGMDETLAAMISRSPKALEPVAVKPDGRRRLAILIAGAVSISTQRRARAIRSLALVKPLQVEDFEIQRSDIYGHLVHMYQLLDDLSTFEALELAQTSSRVSFVRFSRAFPDFCADADYMPGEIAEIFERQGMPDKHIRALIASVSTLSDQLDSESATAIARYIATRSVRLNVGIFEVLAAAGADGHFLVMGFIKYDAMSVDRIVRTLAAAGGDWALLAKRGSRKPRIPVSTQAERLLKKLKAAGIVSSWTESADIFKVNMRR